MCHMLSIIVIHRLNNHSVVSGDIFQASLFMESKVYSSNPLSKGQLVSKQCDSKTVDVGVGVVTHGVMVNQIKRIVHRDAVIVVESGTRCSMGP